jgi:hypothetical protein
MRRLLIQVLQRLAGRGGDPVIQLQTFFGGGKTHSLLAVYHVSTRKCPLSDLAGRLCHRIRPQQRRQGPTRSRIPSLTRTTGITPGRDVAMATMVKEVDETVALSSVADENSDQSSSHRTSSAKMMRYLKDVQRGLLSTDRVA